MRARFVERVERSLNKHGWRTAVFRGCFDIVGVKKRMAFVKVLKNIDSLLPTQAEDLKLLGASMAADVMVVGLRARRRVLRRNKMYERFGIPVLSLESFERYAEQYVYPEILSHKGGDYVYIDSAKLRRARKERALTQLRLARVLGAHKKTIYEHEKRKMKMRLPLARRLERLLDCKLVIEPKPEFNKPQTKPKDHLELEVGLNLKKASFEISYVRSAPFDILTTDSLMLFDVECNKRKLYERASKLSDFVALVKSPALLVSKRANEAEINGVPIVNLPELAQLERKEIIKLASRTIKYFSN